jgi:hypothetical protein
MLDRGDMGRDLILGVLTINRRASDPPAAQLGEVGRHGDLGTKITMRSAYHRELEVGGITEKGSRSASAHRRASD